MNTIRLNTSTAVGTDDRVSQDTTTAFPYQPVSVTSATSLAESPPQRCALPPRDFTLVLHPAKPEPRDRGERPSLD